MLWIFIILLIILIFLGKLIFKDKKRKLLIPFIPILIFFIYSFFFTTGSVRLQIALMGHPIDAYTTGLNKASEGYGNSMRSYYTPTKNIQVTSGNMGYIECTTYGIIKISEYYGF